MEHYYTNVDGWFEQEGLYRYVVNYFEGGRFVEVGSYKGRSTSFMGVEIINSQKNLILDCVDTFEGSEEHKDIDKYKLYQEFFRNTRPISGVIDNIHAIPSLEAAKLYDDESLDFVFIAASHDEVNVLADCEAWYPKIKKGGILGGDDYIQEAWPGVVSAVNKFLSDKNPISLEYWPHWWVEK